MSVSRRDTVSVGAASVFLERSKPVDEEAVDHVAQLLRSKFELKSGFAEPVQLSRQLYRTLQSLSLDTTGSEEELDAQRFAIAMRKLNCGEDRPAVDALFRRYDTSDTGHISMRDFADAVFPGLRSVPLMNPRCRAALVAIRDQLSGLGEDAYSLLRRTLQQHAQSTADGDAMLTPAQLSDALQKTLHLHLGAHEIGIVCQEFGAKDTEGRINLHEFMVGLRPPMSPARTSLVTLYFLRLRTNDDGEVTLQLLREAYVADRHPAVLGGTRSAAEVMRAFDAAWRWSSERAHSIVTERAFLDYHKDLSAVIDNDAYFELLLRNTWTVVGGASDERVLHVRVTHLDGSQSTESLHVPKGSAQNIDDEASIIAALKKRGVTDVLHAAVAVESTAARPASHMHRHH